MPSPRIFFAASCEQFPPEDNLRQAVAAARAGFDGICVSDHLQPWWEGGESSHVWPWLGAVGASVGELPLGTGVTPPGPRYHPAMIAQAWATLERMFPGRPYLGIGSGEALNEVPVGGEGSWPSPADQIARLEEAVEMIRALWDGKTLGGSDTSFWPAHDLRLHTLPGARRPPIWVSAFGEQAAAVAGRVGDGVWCLGDPDTVPTVLDAYRSARSDAGRGDDLGEVVLQAQFAWAPTEEAAWDGARMWKGTQVDDFFRHDWHRPADMEKYGEEHVSDDEFRDGILFGPDAEAHIAGLREIAELGATVIVVQQASGTDPMGAIEFYGREVLPAFARAGAPSR